VRTDTGPSWAEDVVATTVTTLTSAADAERRPKMARYLRDQFAFLGVTSAERRPLLRAAWSKPALSEHRPTDADLTAAATALWNLPEREYQYAACQLLERHLASRRRPSGSADLLDGCIRSLITTKSWWDSVDALRGAAVGPLVARYPGLVAVIRSWSAWPDRWLVRSALIHQLGYGARTDAGLLFELCARHAPAREFFVAKAVGWALRTYARQDPAAVLAFVAEHPQLSPLARREARRHLGHLGGVTG